MAVSRFLPFFAVLGLAAQQAADYSSLQKAYDALKVRQYDTAIAAFQEAVRQNSKRAATHKDLAYTYLKTGETLLAREHFSAAMSLEPNDDHVALEYAFLAYETKQPIAARRVFDRIRRTGNPTAEQAFQNIDRPLAEGIERWSKAVEMEPGKFSGHEELARLAEQRDDLPLAAAHFEQAWKLRRELRHFLLDLGRIWKQQGRTEQATAALLAASRGAESRVAEAARELLPARYPYVYEFETAVKLDSGNVALRRELAYLLLEMGKKGEAESQFLEITQLEPDDRLSAAQLGFLRLNRNEVASAMPLLNRVLKGEDDEISDRIREALKMPKTLRKRTDAPRSQSMLEAKRMAEKSLDAGYLKDALKYLRIAHEHDPVDFSVMYKLGSVHNMLKDDAQAIEWFRLARKSPDKKIASEADNAFRNLRPTLAKVRVQAWALPFYSSRWKDLFSYAQLKSEIKIPGTSLRAYASTRFAGDVRKTLNSPASNVAPQYLSESAFIFAGGVSTPYWKGVLAWAEAGTSVSYLNRRDMARIAPDYRGGLAFGRSFGNNLGAEKHGIFFETNADLVYISRFDHDTLVYAQGKSGYTLPGGMLQLYWNTNITRDIKRLHWANTTEHGPGVRMRVPGLPPSLLFSANAISGRYSITEGNPYSPTFTDLRVGFWYAFSH